MHLMRGDFEKLSWGKQQSMERMKMSISKTIRKNPRCSKNKYHPCDGNIWTKRGRLG
jgi:hypothetical protein